MAYEMFEMLSTCDLEEIAEEDLKTIVGDINKELRLRNTRVKQRAIKNFKEALKSLEYLGVCINYDVSDLTDDLEYVPIFDSDRFKFE